MPLYEYDCLKCGGRFEVLVRGPQAQATVCPACGHDKIERVLSSFAVSSAESRQVSVDSARRRNLDLNKKLDPDKPRTQIDHPHLH
jgi:putative FmdB family regulatory protein